MDELALLLDRAGDLTLEELRARVSDEAPGDPAAELIEAGRAIAVTVPTTNGTASRLVLRESRANYDAAFGTASQATQAARREILARFLALSGPVTVDEIRARYDFDPAWIEQRLADWTARGRLLRARFSLPGYESALRWCSRRVVEQARRRALAAARREIAAVPFTAFAHFVQRWQRVRGGIVGDALDVVRQLYGIPRPPLAWRSEYLPARLDQPDAALSQLGASGELLWVGEGAEGAPASGTLRSIRFLRRGTERAWLGALEPSDLSERATALLALLRQRGASFFFELQQASALGSHALRDALRELVVAGLVTNDTIDAMTAVARWRPLFPAKQDAAQDPARWLPADFVRQNPVVQRRVNVRRLPKWKRPDREGGDSPWPGRWSALDRSGAPVVSEIEQAGLAEVVARQWLDRYGVVARDWWRRERPAVPWRAIYRELRRLEMRGEVRRGYFVEGLAGAQFALPSAVEELRAAAASEDDAIVVLAASDPANVWWLPSAADSFARPRGARQLLVTQRGRVLVTADHRGRSVAVREDLEDATRVAAIRALTSHLASRRQRDLNVEQINGERAATSRYVQSFIDAGFRLTTAGLRYYASFDR